MIRIGRDGVPLAEHARLEGTGPRRRDPAHHTEALTARPRARLVLERERLCALGPEVTAYVTVISQRRRRVLAEELAACAMSPTEPPSIAIGSTHVATSPETPGAITESLAYIRDQLGDQSVKLTVDTCGALGRQAPTGRR